MWQGSAGASRPGATCITLPRGGRRPGSRDHAVSLSRTPQFIAIFTGRGLRLMAAEDDGRRWLTVRPDGAMTRPGWAAEPAAAARSARRIRAYGALCSSSSAWGRPAAAGDGPHGQTADDAPPG